MNLSEENFRLVAAKTDSVLIHSITVIQLTQNTNSLYELLTDAWHFKRLFIDCVLWTALLLLFIILLKHKNLCGVNKTGSSNIWGPGTPNNPHTHITAFCIPRYCTNYLYVKPFYIVSPKEIKTYKYKKIFELTAFFFFK